MGILWLFYQLVMAVALLVTAPFLLVRKGRHYLSTLPGRLTLGDEPPAHPAPGGRLWIHAISVGEVGVAATLVRALPENLPLVVTTVTPTGQERARKLFADRAEVAYLPFDFGVTIRRFFRRFEPAAMVLVEGDYWPRTLAEARRRGLPVAVVNGRVSDRTFPRLATLGPFLGVYFGAVGRFGVQTAEDRRRFLDLGVEAGRVEVTGNLKYESPEPPKLPELERALRHLSGGRPLLVAGSTMEGEERQVLEAFERLGGGERALLVLAPRHPERFDAVAREIEASGLPYTRRKGEGGAEQPAVLLLDSLGELASVYRWAAGAFIGGTLVPTGGHNPLEAARFGVPVAVGPHMHNFQEMAETFDTEGAWRRVSGAKELAEVWGLWLDDRDARGELGARGAALVEANRGALSRSVELIAPCLEAVAAAGDHR